MILHFFYKEWIKTRWAFWFNLLFGLACIYGLFTQVDHRMVLMGAKSFELKVLYQEPLFVYYHWLEFIPLIAGISIGLMQYTPELKDRRFRLAYHLPLDYRVITLVMMCYGWVAISVLNICTYGYFTFANISRMPHEITGPVDQSIMPWFATSYIVYNFIACLVLEPNRKRRLTIGLTAFLILSCFYQALPYHGYQAVSMPLATICMIGSFMLVFLSAFRINKGYC